MGRSKSHRRPPAKDTPSRRELLRQERLLAGEERDAGRRHRFADHLFDVPHRDERTRR